MIYFNLFLQFFHIGFFSFGGGYATLPFLYHIADVHNWYTVRQLADMIAVSAITPGPVGVNIATFAGFTTAGILGAIIATSALVLPSYILVIIISKLLDQFRNNSNVKNAIYALKPAGCGLLASVAVDMFINNTNFTGIIFLIFLFFISTKKKLDPLFYLGTSAIFGLIAGFLGLVV